MNIPEFREQQEAAIERYATVVEEASKRLAADLQRLDMALFSEQAIPAEAENLRGYAEHDARDGLEIPQQRSAGRSY